MVILQILLSSIVYIRGHRDVGSAAETFIQVSFLISNQKYHVYTLYQVQQNIWENWVLKQ